MNAQIAPDLFHRNVNQLFRFIAIRHFECGGQEISISDGIKDAILFSLGSLTAEVIYVRLSLIAMDWIRKQKKIFKILEWVTLIIVLALAVSSFYSALHPKIHKNIILSSSLNKYLLGLIMSAVNPIQIPFWFGWSTVLFTKKILLPYNSHYNIYIAGIGIGTLLGNFVFIFGGKLIANKISSNQNILSWVIGGIFAITALIQLYKIIKRKTPNMISNTRRSYRRSLKRNLRFEI